MLGINAGGACGYTELAGTPYGLSVAAGSAIIFQNGQGCGQCYDVSTTVLRMLQCNAHSRSQVELISLKNLNIAAGKMLALILQTGTHQSCHH